MLSRMEKITQPKAASMFLNVAYGEESSARLLDARRELLEMQIPATIVPGPLIMRTLGTNKASKSNGEEDEGKDSVWIPMPLQLGSSYHLLHRAIDLAYERLVARGGGMEISLGGARSVPHFAHNTWRRMADTAAQAYCARGGCQPEDVDLHMGWQLKKHTKKMRLHYANRGQRAARARITEYI